MWILNELLTNLQQQQQQKKGKVIYLDIKIHNFLHHFRLQGWNGILWDELKAMIAQWISLDIIIGCVITQNSSY